MSATFTGPDPMAPGWAAPVRGRDCTAVVGADRGASDGAPPRRDPPPIWPQPDSKDPSAQADSALLIKRAETKPDLQSASREAAMCNIE